MSPRFFSRRRITADAVPATTSLRPPLPLAKRLNRNALTVAAVIMGMTVLTALVILSPRRRMEQEAAPATSGDESPPPPPRPAFLDEPIHPPTAHSVAAHAVDSTATAPTDTTLTPASRPAVRAEGSGIAQGPTGVALGNGDEPARAPEESPRVRAFRSALSSAVLVGAEANGSPPARASGAGSLVAEEEQMVTLGDSILRTALHPGPGASGIASNRADSATGAGSAAHPASPSFASRAAEIAGVAITAQLEPAGSPFTLRAGTVIPGLLITAINSELPGQIVGQVSRPVYDSRTQRTVLIPPGSRLIGTYDNQIATGQGRLIVAWTRLIFPDGRSMRLPGLALADAAGQSGATDQVDNHWRRVFGHALLLSAISAGVQLSQPAQASVLAAPSARQVAAGAIGQELSNVALEILRRGMEAAPTITIRAGQPFNVFLSGDLVFGAPYASSR